jgi:hypothetical protein
VVSEQGRESRRCVDYMKVRFLALCSSCCCSPRSIVNYMKVRFLALCSCGLPVEEARGVRAGEGVAQDRLLITLQEKTEISGAA